MLRRAARSLVGAAAVLTIAATTACAPAPPASQPTTAPATPLPQPVPSSGDGYELSGWAAPSAFTIRIHPSVAAMTTDITSAAAEVTRLSGISITIGATTSSTEPDLSRPAEIVVTTGTYCGLVAIGCTEMWGQPVTTVEGAPVIRDARVSVVPLLLNDAGLRRATLLHELGHAVGLGHHTDPFLGRDQVMNPYLDDSMDAYRDGDVNGLNAAGTLARSPRSTPPASPQTAGLQAANTRSAVTPPTTTIS